MVRKRGRSSRSDATRRSEKWSAKYQANPTTHRYKKLLPTIYPRLEIALEDLDILEIMAYDKFADCGVPEADYPYYMAFVKRKAEKGLKFTETTRIEEVKLLHEEFVTRGLDADLLECIEPTVDLWIDSHNTLELFFDFGDGTPQGWKLGDMLCCSAKCQNPLADANPKIQTNLGHGDLFSAMFGVDARTGLTHIYGSAYELDLRGWEGATATMLLEYWFISGYPSATSKVSFYDMEDGSLILELNDEALWNDVWYKFTHSDLQDLLGKRVCWLFTKGIGNLYYYWDDILFRAIRVI